MPAIYITQFAESGIDAKGRHVPFAKQPALAVQALTATGTTAQSAVLNANTTLVRINTDANVAIVFGPDPTATTTSTRMTAGQTEYFTVQQNSGLKIAVITV